jgi:hypothetical protein
MSQTRKDRFFVMAAALGGLLALPALVMATDSPDAGGAGATAGDSVQVSTPAQVAPAPDGYDINTSTPAGGAGSTSGVESSTGSVNDVNDASAGNRAQKPDHGDANSHGDLQ